MANIRPLTPELQKIACEELFEVPDRIPKDLEALKQWIKQQPHLKARTDDQFLIAFLRGCKYSLEKAKSKLDKYYTLRTKYPELLRITNIDDPKVLDIIRLGVVAYLPKPLNDFGPGLAIIRHANYSPDKFSGEDIMSVLNLLLDILLIEDDNAIINGMVVILDLGDATPGHLLNMTLGLMKKMTAYSEEASPFRPKATHFLQLPSGFDVLFNIFKPMLSAKQQSRLFVHGKNMETLYEKIPQKYLPREYGGENGSIPEIMKYWEKKVIEYRDYFKDEINYGTNEKLRPGKPIDFDSLYGLDGSFRKLDVD